MLSPRTVLNGGERGQEHPKEAKEKLEARPRTNLNLVELTFLQEGGWCRVRGYHEQRYCEHLRFARDGE